MRTWKRRSQAKETAPAAVQLRGSERHPFALLDGYVPLHEPAFGLYRAIREAVPVVDAAVLKLVRLAGGVHGGTRWASRRFWTAIWTAC